MQSQEPDPQVPIEQEPDPFDKPGLTMYEALSRAMAAGSVLGDLSDTKLNQLYTEYETTGHSNELLQISRAIESDKIGYLGRLAKQNAKLGVSAGTAVAAAHGNLEAAVSAPEAGLQPAHHPRPATRDEIVQSLQRHRTLVKTEAGEVYRKLSATEAEDVATQAENMTLAQDFTARMHEANELSFGYGAKGDAVASTVTHTAKGLAVASLPLIDTVATATWAETVLDRPIGGDVAAGEALRAVSTWISEAKGTDQTARLKFALDSLEEMNIPAAHKAWIASSIVDENSGVVGTGEFDRWASNFGSVADILPFMGKAVKAALGPAGKLLAKGRLRDAREMMAALAPYLARMRNGQAWGMDIRDIGNTQIPKARVVSTPSVMPDGVMEEASRITSIRGDIQQNLDAIRSNNADPEITGARIDKELATIRSVLNGAERPSMSRIGVSPDGNNLEFDVVIGRNQTDGFVNRRDAELYRDRLKKLGVEAKVREIDGNGVLVDSNPLHGYAVGDFYVEAKHTAAVEPVDQLAFGGRAVNGPAWMGRATRYVMPPQWLFNPKLYSKLLSNTLQGAALKANLDKIASPLLQMSGSDKIYVNKMLEWSSTFGESNGKAASWSDLKQAFPDATNTQLKGYYTGRAFYDTVYEINNQRLFNDYTARGFKTLRANGKTYHGQPQGHTSVRPGSAYDPVANAEIVLDQRALDSLYATGGGLIKVERAVESGSGSLHTLIIHRGTSGGAGLSPLASNPLEYVPGYIPRMYESPYTITRIHDNAVVDGKVETRTEGLAVADTKIEADQAVARLNANATAGVRYEVKPDPRLSGKDRTAIDANQLNTENRLFFGERGTRLADVRGGRADVVDPLNMLNKTSAIVSRQVSMEDLVKHQTNQWGVTFEGLLSTYMPKWRQMSHTDRTKRLNEIIQENTGAVAEQAHQARTWMDYIGIMEGTDPAWNGFRKAAVAGAEGLSRALGYAGYTKGLTRAAGNFDPVQAMRSLTYFSYITARPMRQLVLQASQASFVAPMLFRSGINPAYIAKWPIDTWNLLRGVKLRSFLKAGGTAEDSAIWLKSTAKTMGYTTDELTTLIREFENSGVLQGLEMHSIAGDLPKAGREVATTRTQQVAGVAKAPFVGVRDLLQKGFDTGEQWNLTASWMAALKVHMATKKLKKVGALTPADWKEVGELGSEYALAMNRANASKYQYGWLSLATQFLSFTHKATMVPVKLFAGNRVGGKMTRGDAARVLAGQMVLFGGAGLGIHEFVYDKLESNELTRNMDSEIKELIANGSFDYVVDKALQATMDDPEVGLPIAEFAAPAANTASTVASFIEAVFDVGIAESATGPAFSVGGSIGDAVAMAGFVYGRGGDTLNEGVRHQIVAEGLLSGVMAGYSDYTKARAAASAGRWVSSKGIKLPVEARWHEVWARGVLGMTPEALLDYYAITGDLKDREESLNKDAELTAVKVQNIINRWQAGQITDKQQLSLELASVVAIFGSFDELDQDYIATRLEKIYARTAERDGTDTIQMQIAKHLTSGMTPDAKLRSVISRTALLSDIEREATLEMIDKLMAEAPDAAFNTQQRIQEDLDKSETP